MSSLPDWRWHWAQLVSRSHYYVIMLGDVGTHMGLIGKQNLLQLHHYMCYVITKISPAALLRTSPTHATHRLPPHASFPPLPPPPTPPPRSPHAPRPPRPRTPPTHPACPPRPRSPPRVLPHFVFPFFPFYLLY